MYSSGISPAHLRKKHLLSQYKVSSLPASRQVQESIIAKDNFVQRSSSSSTSNSDDFSVVSPKLNRNKPKEIITTSEALHLVKGNLGMPIIRRHTFAIGAEKSVTTCGLGLFIRSVKPINTDSNSYEIKKLVRNRHLPGLMVSKSASNLAGIKKDTNSISPNKTSTMTHQNDKVVKKTILNLSPLSISASSVSSSGGHSNEIHHLNSNSSHSLIGENCELTTFAVTSNTTKVFVTSLANQVGSVRKMSKSNANNELIASESISDAVKN